MLLCYSSSVSFHAFFFWYRGSSAIYVSSLVCLPDTQSTWVPFCLEAYILSVGGHLLLRFCLLFQAPSLSGLFVFPGKSIHGKGTTMIVQLKCLITQTYQLGLHKQYLKTGQGHPFSEPSVPLNSLFHPSHLHADTLHCACQLRADQV